MTPDPNHRVQWQPTRPEFSINFIRSISNSRCYHESWYEIISRHPLTKEDLARLDDCNLLGMGQAFYLEKTETITDLVPPVTIDDRTGMVIDVPPVNWQGFPITKMTSYDYQKYTIKRICDSGD